jgi:hemolysin-activating ACP:hemolysin acyltransferase
VPALFDDAKLFKRDEALVDFASWAFLPPEAAGRYGKTGWLGPGDWTSHSEPRLINLVAPLGGEGARGIAGGDCSAGRSRGV